MQCTSRSPIIIQYEFVAVNVANVLLRLLTVASLNHTVATPVSAIFRINIVLHSAAS